GFYLAVLKEGEVGAGDEFLLIKRNEPSVTVNEVTSLYSRDKENVALMRRAIAVEALPESWRSYFRERLDKQK
ncbi:MAG TPA: 3-alpha domain-containing protein, partial [Pyrinomonadaceae bacterium]|nr:3-alpha domain-containing protein [Pyrinomonadaceae bacterium]